MRITSVVRINLTIVAVCISALMLVSVLGILPDERLTLVQQRARLAETLAMSLTHLVSRSEFAQADRQLKLFAKRNPDLLSAGLRRKDGSLVALAGDHQSSWQTELSNMSDGCYVVPVRSNRDDWGVVEARFTPLYSGFAKYLNPALIELILILGTLIGLATWLHLSRILKYLDPSQVVPPRVRQTLDSFSEGVVLLDSKGRMVLVNAAFSQSVCLGEASLIGKSLNELGWRQEDTEGSSTPYPWQVSKERRQSINSSTISLVDSEGSMTSVFSVNSSPVLDERQRYQGAMVVFADVTPLERKRKALASALEKLSLSQVEVSRQNEELRFLATRDPLTSCINRRTFFEKFDKFWAQSATSGVPLCAMMVDIDYFKPINDTYGHSKGDEVLRQTGALLNQLARPTDIVCRYGGEEFSVLMPGINLDEAAASAEVIRQELANLHFGEFTITASLGLSAYGLGAADPQSLLDEADKCLYVAKRNGRNQVVRYDTVPQDLEVDESKISRTKPAVAVSTASSIPYAAVTALLSALTYREHKSGAHSARVANYAAKLAQQFLRPREVYVIEMAGLLHDIGKIGVPDAILLKPGRLTDEEWKIMKRHDMIGVEIIRKSFKHEELTSIVRHYQCRWDGATSNEGFPLGEQIPIGSRILSIADAFDAMITDWPYRKGKTIAEALAELRRCAGSQFDPSLVEQFCKLAEAGEMCAVDPKPGLSSEVVLGIGEQIESLMEAIDAGNRETILALGERLRQTANQSATPQLEQAIASMIDLANENATIEQIALESLELLNICRHMHRTTAEIPDLLSQ